ncbi:hypothetical protein TRIP_C60404 [Candidatus Zixiibacteriota bacterium]|nr:hypothetical protein TRIP_C60404 [candidate division Zixibacteria bacterium]
MTTIKFLTMARIKVIYRSKFFWAFREVLRLEKFKFATANRAVLTALLILMTLPVLLFSQGEIKGEISTALNSGDTTTAIDLLQKDIKLDPSFSANYYVLGQIYENQGKLKEAEEQYQLSYDKNSRFYEGLYALGLVQLKEGKKDEATKNFSEGIKKAKDMKAAFYNGMGLAYISRAKYDSAANVLYQAIVLDSTKADYHINLGDANYYLKFYPIAVSEYEKALAMDTGSTEVYFHLAEACLEMKDYNCALEKLKIVLTKDSTLATAWLRAGSIYYKAARSSRTSEEAKQRYMEAIGSYKKYIDLIGGRADSTSGRAYYEAGMAYLLLGGYVEAKEDFAKVLSIPVEPKDIYFYDARAFQGNNEFDSALYFYNKHIEWVKKQGADFKSGIGEDELYRRMGECYESLKDYQNTIDYFKKSLAIDSTQDRLYYGIAISYNYLGDYRSALIYYMKRIAMGVDERGWSIYYNAATSALYLAEKSSQGQPAGGTADDSTAGPDPLAGIDLTKLAASYLEKVMEFKPDNMKAASMLASIDLYQLSECSKAVDLFQKVLAAEPDNCDALKSLGYADFSGICSKNYSRSLDYLNKALNCSVKKGNSECSDPNLLLWIGQVYEFRASDTRASDKAIAKKDYKAAFDWYNKVLKCDPGNKAAKDGIDRVKFEY